MGKLASLYDPNPSDYKLDWHQWRQSACWWVNSVSRQSPNTQWLNRHCLKTRYERSVALVLWDLSDLFKHNSSLRFPFLSLNLYFLNPCTVFSCPPSTHTPQSSVLSLLMQHLLEEWLHSFFSRALAEVIACCSYTCFLGPCALFCLQIPSRCGARILAVFPGVLQPSGGQSS